MADDSACPRNAYGILPRLRANADYSSKISKADANRGGERNHP